MFSSPIPLVREHPQYCFFMLKAFFSFVWKKSPTSQTLTHPDFEIDDGDS